MYILFKMFEESILPRTISVLCIRRRYSRVRNALVCIGNVSRVLVDYMRFSPFS